MEVIIHRGTHQIGGCVTEIKSSKGTRIAIDIGENLPSSKVTQNEEIKIEGLTEGEKDFEAVFITHYHGDHIGLYDKILEGIPIYIGDVSKVIYKKVQSLLVAAKKISKEKLDLIDSFETYKIPQKIRKKDILITPIEVDHSAFNAHMLLIECDGKRLLHTGDFRTHGQRGKSVLPAIEKYVGKVDCLICEGTMLSRVDEPVMTEHEIQQKAEEIFRENKYSFVYCSSTNIDRIAAIHKAAIKSRKFICDSYQKDILMYIDSIARSDLYKFKGKVLSYDNNIIELMKQDGFVMLIRDNYISKIAMKEFPNNVFIYSNWNGYLDKNRTEYERIQKFVPENHIYLHTSGHADYETIKSVCELVKPELIIPIHTEKPDAFETMGLENCQIKLAEDGKIVKI